MTKPITEAELKKLRIHYNARNNLLGVQQIQNTSVLEDATALLDEIDRLTKDRDDWKQRANTNIGQVSGPIVDELEQLRGVVILVDNYCRVNDIDMEQFLTPREAPDADTKNS